MSHFPWMLAATSLIQGALMMLLPHFSPRRYFFGITVAPEFRAGEEARAALRRYRTWVAVAMVVSVVAVIAISAWPATLDQGFVFVETLPVLVGLAAFVRERSAARRYAVQLSAVREATLSTDDDRLPAWTLLALPPFAALAAAFAYLSAHWEDIPARFAVHWGANGQANEWTTRSVRGVYGPLLFGAGMMVLMILIALAHYYGARRGPQRVVILKVFLAMVYLLGVNFIGIGHLPLMRISPLWFLIPTPLFLVAVLWLSFRAAATDPGDPTPDECWHALDIYYNPNDPALFVQKRIGFGFTFNFGNRLSWAILGGLFVGMGGLMFLLR
jgi:uncharacterized membrane protein